MWRRGTTVALLAVLVAGCQLLGDVVSQQPHPCEQQFSARRCMAIAQGVMGDAAVPPRRITAIEIIPRADDGVTLSSPGIEARVTLDDGSVVTGGVCAGVGFGPGCTDEPSLRASSVTIGGYGDVPCAGEAPDGCATPVPPPDPEQVAASSPIRVDAVRIPIDHIGDYAVSVGEGSVPNGILTEASFRFAEPWPEDVGVAEAYVLLDVRSLEAGGRPFDNIHLHGRTEGSERVEAVVVFRVLWFEPGATLELVDIVVR